MSRSNQLGTLLAVAIATVAALAVVQSLTWQQEKGKIETEMKREASRTANIARALIERRTAASRSTLRALSTSSELRGALAQRSQERIARVLNGFRTELDGMHVLAQDPSGQPLGSTSPLAMLSLQRTIPVPNSTSGWQAIGGELALTMNIPVEVSGRRLGSLVAAIVIDRDFVQETGQDLGAPIGILLDGRVMRHTFAGEFEQGRLELVDSTAEIGGIDYTISQAYLSDRTSSISAQLFAGVDRSRLTAARARYLRLGGLTAGVGLLVALLGVGGYLAYSSRRERILIAQRDAAETRSKGLSDRVSHLTAVVHDIKAPLSGIQLRAESLEEETDDAEVRSALQTMVETCEKMNLYLVNVLTAAQAEEGPLAVRSETILLPGLLDDIADRLTPVSQARSVGVQVDARDDLDPINGDSTLLERAILNLAYNALAVSSSGATITLFARTGDGEVAIGVEDEGPGLPFAPDEAFSRSRPQVKHHSIKAGSSGLGLYIVDQIAAALGGTTRAENLPRGARMAIVLPR